MLIWLESEERNLVLPRTISLRRKSAIEAEITCEKIQEVASSTDDDGSFRREKQLELESLRLVHERMQEAGISVPRDRESTLLSQLRSEIPGNVGEKVFTTAFLEEIKDLETRFAAGEFSEEVEVDSPKRSPDRRGRPTKRYSHQFLRLRDLRYRQNAELLKYQKLQEITRGFHEIYSMQRKVQVAESSERRVLEEELKQRTRAWKEVLSDLPLDNQESVFVMLDNIRAVETKPPTLMWDRREFEPLKVHPDEFYPPQEMCLLDFQPKSLWSILQKDFPENYDVLEYILGQLLIIPTQTIKRGLSSLVPGAYEYLIAECPSLTDPTKGGSLDISLMTVRRLTEEMFKEIIEAWARWPFKPTRNEVMSRMGSVSYDPDGLETEDLG
jgi:transcription factor 1